MNYKLRTTTKFKKDYKRCSKRGCDMNILKCVVEKLLEGEMLEEKYYNHQLHGNYEGFYECHLQPDWLLIYAINNDELILTASRTGTHSDLFEE